MATGSTKSPGLARQWWERAVQRLMEPVDIATLAYFRVAFGVIMLWEVYHYVKYDFIYDYWILPEFNFTYYGFSWVKPLPGDLMYVHMAALAILSACVILGYRYRLTMTLLFFGFGYTFLLEQARYLNHFYFVCLVAFVMIFMPANRAWSLDVRRGAVEHSSTTPVWAPWMIRFLMGVVYFYGGLAKIGSDWLKGAPLDKWLANRSDFPLFGHLFVEEWTVMFFSWGGLLFDLLVVPALLWRRTRIAAFVVAVWFHLMNALLFQIGIFPWFAIVASSMYFGHDWPRRWLSETGSHRPAERKETEAALVVSNGQRRILAGLACFAAFQLIFPFRHHLYPGNPNWTEEGHRFSWHMKLRSKDGTAVFYVSAPRAGREWVIDPDEHLEDWQEAKMVDRPDMILQFAHYLAELKRREGYDPVEVRVDSMCSLNGREMQQMIDPDADLAAIPRSLRRAKWILPLTTPFPDRRGESEAAIDVLDE